MIIYDRNNQFFLICLIFCPLVHLLNSIQQYKKFKLNQPCKWQVNETEVRSLILSLVNSNNLTANCILKRVQCYYPILINECNKKYLNDTLLYNDSVTDYNKLKFCDLYICYKFIDTKENINRLSDPASTKQSGIIYKSHENKTAIYYFYYFNKESYLENFELNDKSDIFYFIILILVILSGVISVMFALIYYIREECARISSTFSFSRNSSYANSV